MNIVDKEKLKEIQNTFDINAIYAQHIFEHSDKTKLIEDARRIIAEKPKPFVKWVGGKRQLLKQFRTMSLYSPEKFNPKTSSYYEPFVGGGAVFFDLLPQKAFLSDMNFELVATYNAIKNNVNELINSLKKHSHNKEYFLEMRLQNPKELNNIEVASRFIFLNRTCFNGMYRVNSKGGFNVPFGKYENPLICDEENLRRVSEALHFVEIKHQDYKQILNTVKKGDFIYFDPPYYPLSKTASFTFFVFA